jgi:PadR family transcriptional regulator, regulatory protein PadR
VALTSLVVTGILRRMVGRRESTDGALTAQLRRGVLEYCVMALLEREDRYGFELVEHLAGINGMGISEGTIYPLLSRLRRDGLLQSYWEESPSGPPRRYYRLSPSGKKDLGTFREDWERFRNAVDRVLKEEGK